MEKKNKMGYMPMPKLMINMSLPLMLSLLIQSLYNIVDSIFVARLGQATIPIVGYNFGAGQKDRVWSAFRVAVPIAAGIAVLGTALFCAFSGQLLGLFDADAGMLSMGIPALRIISVTFVFAAVTIILGYVCSGLGNGVINMLGTGLRQVVILVPLLWLFTRIWGVSAAWYAFWVAEPAALVYAVLSSLHLLRKRNILDK